MGFRWSFFFLVLLSKIDFIKNQNNGKFLTWLERSQSNYTQNLEPYKEDDKNDIQPDYNQL